VFQPPSAISFPPHTTTSPSQASDTYPLLCSREEKEKP
jgi:hypothetical protein